MIRHSKIFRGEVIHERMTPQPHAFTYPHTFFAFELSELDQLSEASSLLGHNEFRPLTIKDEDYLHGLKHPISDQLATFLPPEAPGQHTLLITSPRYFSYAFNPVNFHLRMQGDELLCAVAEVNNTFGDRHVYPLTALQKKANTQTWTARCPKDFHVSPFNNMEGEYHFTFRVEEDFLFLGVDLHRDGKCVLKTWIRGKGHAITSTDIFRYALLHPFDTALNSLPRITWQAAILYYKKHLKAYKRPSPTSKHTLIDRDHPEPQQPVI